MARNKVEVDIENYFNRIDDKLDKIHETLSDLSVKVATTNGKVKMHTKMIIALTSAVLGLAVAGITSAL